VFDHNYVKKIDGPKCEEGQDEDGLAEQLRDDIRISGRPAGESVGHDVVRVDGVLYCGD